MVTFAKFTSSLRFSYAYGHEASSYGGLYFYHASTCLKFRDLMFDLAGLSSPQDELLDTLRCNGRRQAARRGASRRDGTERAEGEQESDEDMGYGAGAEGSPAARGGMSNALAGGGIDFFQTAEMGGSRSSRPPSH